MGGHVRNSITEGDAYTGPGGTSGTEPDQRGVGRAVPEVAAAEGRGALCAHVRPLTGSKWTPRASPGLGVGALAPWSQAGHPPAVGVPA